MNSEHEDDWAADLLIEMGFCGCGSPEAAAEFLGRALEFIKWKCDLFENKTDHSTAYKEFKARELEVFGSEGCATFVYYVLDRSELTIHGGSVPGWLSSKGEELLAAIKSPPRQV